MQVPFVVRLEEVISPERLSGYVQGTDLQAHIDGLALYLWNISLCEALYPALNCIEVALRNSIHTAISDKFRTAQWFMMIPPILRSREIDSVLKAIKSIQAARGTISIVPSPGRIIAELNLGFWGALFYPAYDQIFWPGLLKPAFPYMPPRARTRLTLFQRVDEHRWLRNRIFHYEPIWKDPNLRDYHNRLVETIGWIRPEMQQMTLAIDRFADVLQSGPLVYRTKIEALLTVR